MSDNKLRQVRKYLGINQKELSDILGITQAYVSKMESDEKPIGKEVIKLLSERYNISAEWLLLGIGDMVAKNNVHKPNAVLLDTAALASYYAFAEKAPEVESYMIIPDLPPRSDMYIAVNVSGDSMWPSINDGDIVVFDPNALDLIKEDSVHLVSLKSGLLLIKRLRSVIDRGSPNFGRIALCSDNEMYKDQFVDRDDIASLLRAVRRITKVNL